MRTLILLSMAAFCLLGGCSRTEGERDSQTEIRLGTKGVTRAVNTLGDLSDVGDRIGIYGVRIAGTSAGASGKESWGNELVMDNVRTWRKIVPSNSAPIIPMPQPVPTEIVSWRRRRRGKLPRCISP